jgi:hypothetical protein
LTIYRLSLNAELKAVLLLYPYLDVFMCLEHLGSIAASPVSRYCWMLETAPSVVDLAEDD